MFKKFFRDQDGVVIVLFALGMTVFLGFLALVVDVGRAEAVKFKLSNAVDAAALAGAQELPNTMEAENKAKNTASLNGVDDVMVSFSDENHKIRVHAKRTVNMLFAGALGVTDTDVGASAAAAIAPISAAEGVVPVGLEKQELEYGKLYTLKEGGGDGSNGWYGALDFRKKGGGSHDYEYYFKNGYPGSIRLNDEIELENGSMSGGTLRAITSRINACHHTPFCTVDEFSRDCPRLVTVAVVDLIYKKNNKQVEKVKVVGFALLLLENISGNGNDSVIKGHFVESIIPGEINPELPSYGASGVCLVE